MYLHISHNDLDGIACGILVKACIPSVQTRYTNYDELETLLKNIPDDVSTVIITDLGPSVAAIDRLVAEKEVILIDHHASTIPLKHYHFVTHAIGKSAALLTYEYFTEKGYDLTRYKNFIDGVNDFDIWILNRSDSLQLNMLLSLLGTYRFEKRFFTEPYTGFKPDEEFMLSLEGERKDSYITRATKNVELFTDKEQRTFAVVFAESYVSELGNHIIASGIAEYVFLINAQRKKCSIRSSRDIDISKIAMKNGGGGHKNAAGFNLETDLGVSDLLKDLGLIY